MKRLLPLSLLLYLVLLTGRIYAQTSYSFQQLDNSNGLSNSCVNDIFQDTDNLIWFATWDGLNIYNGSTFHIFNYSKGNLSNSLASNVIYQLGEDKKDNIWICTVSGISKYNKKRGKFSHYLYNHKNVPGRGYILAIDPAGRVYCASGYGDYINYYDTKLDSFKRLPVQGSQPGMITKIGFDGNNNLWVLKDNGNLEVYSKTGNGFSRVPVLFNTPADNFFYVNRRFFYTTKTGGLFVVSNELNSKKILDVPHQVRSMTCYNDHYIFAWSSKGFGEYDETFKPISDILSAVPSLANLRITSIMLSKEKVLWFGTDGSGVIKVSKKNDYLHVVQKQPNGQPLNIPIRTFCEVNGELWVGTKGNGIITIKNLGRENVSFSRISSFHAGTDLLDNCVYSIHKGTDQLIYIGSDAPGITVFDPEMNKLIKWQDIEGNNTVPFFNSVHSILSDADSSLWLGLNADGLIHLKLKRQAGGRLSLAYFKHYNYSGTGNGPGSDVIYTLASAGDSAVWAGCRYGGLSLFNKRTKKFKTLKAFSYEGSLSNNDILSLYRDKKGRLWVGTSFGLNWITEEEAGKKAPVFKKLYVEDGLPNNTIHAISEDNSGNIWVSTNKGLARINPETLKIIQFKEADGLQSDEFSDNAVWKNKDGYLFFGGIYGFNYFLPEQVHTNTVQPNLLISELQLGGKNSEGKGFSVLRPGKNQLAPHYNVAPADNYFELSVQPVAFSNLQKCRYAYFLEGYDKIWHYPVHDQKVSYSSIPPGNYRLMVRWTNGEGVWTKPAVALNLTVRQYFWLTLPAYLLYLLVLSVAGYVVYRYRRNKFIMGQKLLVEHTLRKKEEEMHLEQVNFFTNISHELQTPLTLILGAIDRYFYKETKSGKHAANNHFLSIVKQEASRLHYLVHQLLEFRKAESGHLQNHYTFLNVSNLLENIAGLFLPLTDSRALSFTSQIEPDIELLTDKDKLEKIIFNLLSNAFKHSPANEHIIFSAYKTEKGDQLEIIVANSGCELSEEDQQKIFDRFFIVDNNQQNKFSSGIGLAFTRQLVSLLGGNISVSCENKWVSFKIGFPLLVQEEQESLIAENAEKIEKPSYILKSITADQPELHQPDVTANNKKAILNSFEECGKKNVLIVEDDQSIRFLLRDILSEHYIVYEAANGREALGVMGKMIPHLIVSDIMMPDMDGLELCNMVKTTPDTCHVPFIILTARGTVEQKIEGYETGADAYIAKPFHADHLLVRIRKLIEYQERLHHLFAGDQLSVRIKETGMKDSDKTFLESIVKIIESNIDNEALDAAFLEQKMALSKMQLYRKLKALSNMTPGELIRNIRLQQAALLLKSTDLTVSEIFYRTGFNNQSYFYREFKKQYQFSPNEYRAQHRIPVVNT